MMKAEQLPMVLVLAVLAAIFNMTTALMIAGPGCLHVPRGYAPSKDAKSLIEDLVDSPDECCKLDTDDFCSVVASSGDAELNVCGCTPFCVPCRVAGSYILGVHDTCVVNGKVQGYFSLDGTSCRMLQLNRRGTWRKIKPIKVDGPPSLLGGAQI